MSIGQLSAIGDHDREIIKAIRESPEFALVKACECGDIDACRALLHDGVDPDTTRHKELYRQLDWPHRYYASNDEIVALNAAVRANRVDICQLLIDAGADVNIEGCRGATPLSRAIDISSEEICGLLLGNGANANVPHCEDGAPLLSSAIYELAIYINNLELCRKITSIDDIAHIPGVVHHETVCYNICRLLLEHGARVDYVVRGWEQLISVAVHAAQSAKICELLEDYGADIDCALRSRIKFDEREYGQMYRALFNGTLFRRCMWYIKHNAELFDMSVVLDMLPEHVVGEHFHRPIGKLKT